MEIATWGVGISLAIAKEIIKEQGAIDGSSRKIVNSIIDTITSKSSPIVTQALKERLNNLSSQRRVRQEILKNSTVFDVVGVAWAEELGQIADADLSLATEARRAFAVRRQLNPVWFKQVLLLDTEIGFVVGEKFTSTLPEGFFEQLSKYICEQVVDELGLNSRNLHHLDQMIRGIAIRLPTRVARIYLADNSFNISIIRQQIGDLIVPAINGSNSRQRITSAFRRMARVISQTLSGVRFFLCSEETNDSGSLAAQILDKGAPRARLRLQKNNPLAEKRPGAWKHERSRKTSPVGRSRRRGASSRRWCATFSPSVVSP